MGSSITFTDEQKERIYLTGFMGAGKSSVGLFLSRMLSYRIIDTDKLIEKETGLTIEEIFKTRGEKYFRELEQGLIRSSKDMKNLIIATGGGAPTFEDNMEVMNKQGISICLMARPEIILERVKNDKTVRPLLKADNVQEKLNLLIQKRVYYYILSHILIDTSDKNVEEISREIAGIIRE